MRGYLIDTHVLIWSTSRDPKLSDAHAALLAGSGPFFFSMASLWEIAIKQSIGKLKLKVDFTDDIADRDLSVLPIDLAHVRAVRVLEKRHGDPFDRMLIAQAVVEGLTLLTDDEAIRAYDVPTA